MEGNATCSASPTCSGNASRWHECTDQTPKAKKTRVKIRQASVKYTLESFSEMVNLIDAGMEDG